MREICWDNKVAAPDAVESLSTQEAILKAVLKIYGGKDKKRLVAVSVHPHAPIGTEVPALQMLQKKLNPG
ncbi:MAG: hypothetical protein EB059_10235 [Alphaproteobacteria bacterium]|nr:hypothetical protein [Alphaproteobacteria bacterium]